jgi:hypothetical protein
MALILTRGGRSPVPGGALLGPDEWDKDRGTSGPGRAKRGEDGGRLESRPRGRRSSLPVDHKLRMYHPSIFPAWPRPSGCSIYIALRRDVFGE